MSILEAAALGLFQGLAEFLPISSSGHLNLLQALFGVELDHQLLFNILLHVGTLVAGEPLTVIEETRDFWIVSFRQACCYVWKEASVWLDTEAPNAPTLGWIVLNEKQKVYTGPGTGWKALATEEAGMEFRLVGQEGNWYKIAYGDYFAYVQKSKVTLR